MYRLGIAVLVGLALASCGVAIWALNGWRHAENERFWAARDLQDAERDVGRLNHSVARTQRKLDEERKWQDMLIACHQEYVKIVLEDADAALPVRPPEQSSSLFMHAPCEILSSSVSSGWHR